MARIVTLYPNWENIGGAQNIAYKLALHLNEIRGARPLILCDSPDKVIDFYRNGSCDFQAFSLRAIVSLNSDDIILSHHRKLTSFVLTVCRILHKRNRIIHCAHNVFNDKRFFTCLPSEIIAVSSGVKENLVDYFRCKPEQVTVIFNGIKDAAQGFTPPRKPDGTIRILMAGRLCAVKRQLQLVMSLKDVLTPSTHIYFAGDGKDLPALQAATVGLPQFHVLGNINMNENLPNYDYVLLFSEKEGLGLTLIEGCMFSKPLISNDLTSVCDVNHDGVNGFTYHSWEELATGLAQLPAPGSDRYLEMAIAARNIYEAYFTEDKMLSAYNEYINYFHTT